MVEVNSIFWFSKECNKNNSLFSITWESPKWFILFSNFNIFHKPSQEIKSGILLKVQIIIVVPIAITINVVPTAHIAHMYCIFEPIGKFIETTLFFFFFFFDEMLNLIVIDFKEVVLWDCFRMNVFIIAFDFLPTVF